MQDGESKDQAEEMLNRHIAREQASIRFGFPLGIAAIVILAIWFIVWRINAGPVEKALVEIMSRRIKLPESRFAYPLDSAPLLEEQWGREAIPVSPLGEKGPNAFLIVHRSGHVLVPVPGKGAPPYDLVVAADQETAWSSVRSAVEGSSHYPGQRRLWLAVRTSETVGKAGEEVKLEPEERSEFGIVPVAVFLKPPLPPEHGAGAIIKQAPPNATFAEIVQAVEGVFARGSKACLLETD